MTCSTSATDFRSLASMRKGQRCTSFETNAPSPWRVVTSPSARNAATASRTTVRLTPVASELVKPPRVGESHIHMECRLLQTVQVSDKPGGGTLVLGEVLRFHVREDLIEDFRIDPDKLRAIGRMAGSTYVRTSDRFDLERP